MEAGRGGGRRARVSIRESSSSGKDASERSDILELDGDTINSVTLLIYVHSSRSRKKKERKEREGREGLIPNQAEPVT